MILSIKGGETLVDDDFTPPGKYLRVSKDGYADVVIYVAGDEGRPQAKYRRLHRIVIGARDGEIVDHINHNKLDNRRSNLRICTRVQNAGHQKSVRGWTRHRCGRFQAAITVSGKLMHLGLYRTPEEAAAAYQRANLALRGAFAATVRQ